jgi:predicted phage tail protein
VAVEQSGTGVDVYTRRGGTDNATLIHSDFERLSQVWTDGRQMTLNQSLVYQTRSTVCEAATFILYLPTMQTESGGNATLRFIIEISTVAANSYETIFPNLQWSGKSLGGRYRQIRVTFPSVDQWLVKLTLTSSNNAQDVTPSLFNVMEEQSGSALYPNCALMAFVGIASNQIQSFDAMRGSGLVKGLKVDVWDGGGFTNQWTNKRAWIIRHVLTDERIGLGHRIDASLFDDAAALDVQNYWDGIGYGSITRDECNVLINDRRAEWDWIKVLLSEGRAALVPSGGKLKLIVDKDDTPGLPYAMPGNIVPDTLLHRQGSGQALIPNNILYQFVDQDNKYQTHAEAFRAPGTGGEPLREAPALSFYTLTDWNRAYWLARYTLLRQRLMQRHLEWHSPSTALVSEPLDHVSLSYDTPDFSRGASGFLGPDSSTTRLVLDQLVTLAPSTTYSVLVRHQADNSVEERTVSTGAGDWGALTLSSALSTAPAAGDIYVVGVVGSSIMHLVIEAVEQSDDLTYRLTASEYVSDVYAFPGPPSSPYTPPTPPPPAIGGGQAPDPPAVHAVFVYPGTMQISWQYAPIRVLFDYYTNAQIWFSPFDLDHFELYHDMGGTYGEYEEQFDMLREGYFAVRTFRAHGGWSRLSEGWHTDWQGGESSEYG